MYLYPCEKIVQAKLYKNNIFKYIKVDHGEKLAIKIVIHAVLKQGLMYFFLVHCFDVIFRYSDGVTTNELRRFLPSFRNKRLQYGQLYKYVLAENK